MHSAAAGALVRAAGEPGSAAELAECAPFWALHRLLLREGLPLDLKAQGQVVVSAVKEALLAESGGPLGLRGAAGGWLQLAGCRAVDAATVARGQRPWLCIK